MCFYDQLKFEFLLKFRARETEGVDGSGYGSW